MKLDPLKIREPLIEALSQSPLLQYLGKSGPYRPELREMLSSSEVRQYPKGENIIVEGEASDGLYVLAVGSVSILVDGKEVCTMIRPGEIFGEFGALTGDIRSATVQAREDVTCLAVSPLVTSKISLEENSLFSNLVQRALTKILLGRLTQTNAELVATQEKLERVERQATFLRVDNDTLSDELDNARKKIQDGLHGTRAGEHSA